MEKRPSGGQPRAPPAHPSTGPAFTGGHLWATSERGQRPAEGPSPGQFPRGTGSHLAGTSGRYPLGPMWWVAAHLPSKRGLGSCLVGSSQKNPQHGPQASQSTSLASHRPPAPVSAAPWAPASLRCRQAASSEHLHPARGRAPPFHSSVSKARGCSLNST